MVKLEVMACAQRRARFQADRQIQGPSFTKTLGFTLQIMERLEGLNMGSHSARITWGRKYGFRGQLQPTSR